jgi:hypothetical protein
MSSTIEKNKLKNSNQQRSNPNSKSGQTTATSGSVTQTFKKGHDNNDNNTRGGGEEGPRRIKKRRPTKVGLNDTLLHIRQLMVEGRSNLEIQNILQLEERTYYRYMAKINEIDQALFAEQEKKMLTTEMGIFKDRLLKSFRWYIAIRDNENIKPETRMEAQQCALEVALALLKLEQEGPNIIWKEGL